MQCIEFSTNQNQFQSLILILLLILLIDCSIKLHYVISFVYSPFV